MCGEHEDDSWCFPHLYPVTYEELLAENKRKDERNNSLENLIERQAEKLLSQADEIAHLKQQLAEIKKLVFGSKREQFISTASPEQLHLFASPQAAEVPAVEKEQITYERKKKQHPGRETLPEHLPVEEVIIEPEGDLSKMRKIGAQVVETLKYSPASLIRLRHIYPKYEVLDTHGESKIIQAETRTRSVPKCPAENSLLAYILISKFIDHLPFYRQIQKFKREYGWVLNKSTVNDWFIAVCTLLEPLYEKMVQQLLEGNYLQADESHIKVQDADKSKATHMGWQWVYHALCENLVIFHYRKGRGVHGAKEFLADYKGYLQCDGYGVYDKIGQKPGIHLVGCHVHARRYFVKALDTGDNRADIVLHLYQQIFQLEKSFRELTPGERKIQRQQHIKPLFMELKSWLDEQSITVLPKSPLGKAITYTLGQWPKLMAVSEDGILELDNNLIENKIRPLALGRKNYLFAGSHDAAQRMAMIYSFFATCKANEVNPYEWLVYVLDHIGQTKINQLEKFIPKKGMLLSPDSA